MMSSDEQSDCLMLPIAELSYKDMVKEKKEVKEQKELVNYLKLKEANAKDFHDVDMLLDYRAIAENEGKEFRISNKSLLLTYAGFIDKKDLIEFIQSKSKSRTTFIRVAHEPAGVVCKDDLTHVVVSFSKLFTSISPKVFDYKTNSPCIRKLNSSNRSAEYDKAVRFLSRSDKDNIDLESFGNNYANLIWKCESEAEALAKYAKSANDASGISHIYHKKQPEAFPIRFKELGGTKWDSNEMQSYIFGKLLEVNEPNYDPDEGSANRKIIWIYNRKGSSGKSVLCTDIFRAKLAHIIPNGGGGSANVAQNLRGAMEKGWNGRAVFFDFARNLDKADKDYLYEILEMVKNGLLNCSKYESCTLDLGGSPLIVIMANFLPRLVNKDTLEPTMSFDKWDVKVMANNTGSQGCFDEVATAKFAQKISVESIKYDKRQLVEDDNDDDEEERAQKKSLKASGMIDVTDKTDKFMQNYNKIIEKKY